MSNQSELGFFDHRSFPADALRNPSSCLLRQLARSIAILRD